MTTVTITHADNSTETIDETLGWERTREIGAMRKLVIMVNREDASGVTLNRQEDKVELGSVDTTLLVDVEKHGSIWKLITYSREWAANKEEPTAGGVKRTGDDQSQINTAIGNVSAWTAGTVSSLTGSLTFILNHALEHEAIRRVERNVPGEILFRDYGTVDYTTRLGSDKSASVTLSAANANLDGEINITSRGRELDGTHVRVLGAHEGEAQLFANLVPTGDGGTYENRVNYTTSRWADASDTVWDRWQNKDVTDQATIEEEAATLGEELTETLVEAKATVVGEDIGIGDTVHVEKRDTAGNLVLDRDMRIHRIKTVKAGATERDEVLLSTRTVMRQDDGKDLRDIQRFNTAFQGTAIWGTPGAGFQAVTSTENYRLPFFYPNVTYEHNIKLYVESQPYRTFDAGAATNPAFSSIEQAAASDGGTTVGDTGWTTLDTVNLTAGDAQWLYGYSMFLDASSQSVDLFGRWNIDNGTQYWPDVGGQEVLTGGDSNQGYLSATLPGDYAGSSIDIEAQWALSSGQVALDGEFITAQVHAHDPEPGVTNFANTTASGVDVVVNGTTELTDIGSGTFTTVEDISGTLTKGQFNTIELASDSTGWLLATAGIEAYRQLGTV